MEESVLQIAQSAKNASIELRTLSAGLRNKALQKAAELVRIKEREFIEENKKDMAWQAT